MAIKVNNITIISDTRNVSNVSNVSANAFIGDGSQLSNVNVIGPLVYNTDNVTSNITISSGRNALSVGPININNNVNVTITNNQRWIVI